MSRQLIEHSQDLKRLRDEGYDIEIKDNHLLVKRIPYVNSRGEIYFGTLVSELTLAGNVTAKPQTHVVHFMGEYPCNKDGSEISSIRNQSGEKMLGPNLKVQHAFSNKPSGGYTDYYDKMKSYAGIISGPALSMKPELTERPNSVIPEEVDNSPFCYYDSASSRAGITFITSKLEESSIGIIGLGGTGSYILDLVAKTPVKEIRLYDGDKFLQHNAFRAPGAPSLDELKTQPFKVDYLKGIYSKMHRNILSFPIIIDEESVHLLQDVDFVFLSLDSGKAKRVIIQKLEDYGISFIDVGLGVGIVNDALHGIVRVTTSTPSMRDHVHQGDRSLFSDGAEGNEYHTNIQIADLNALNASLAVIKWKKIMGFYADVEKEYYSAYAIDGDNLINEDHA